MIWSSRARNRSFEPVVLCFFGRIVRPPIGRENHASLLEGIAKSNLQGSDAQSTKTLQSQTHLPTRMRFQISRFAVLHRRLVSAQQERSECVVDEARYIRATTGRARHHVPQRR